jgi:murein DD-endopeptidase MepM/ murein hydrolase activator NlpD
MAEKKYTVKEGDTLKSLAKTFYGDQIHADALRQINQIAPQDDVRVAMDLILPPRVVSLGPSEKLEDKTVKHILYGKLQEKLDYLFPLPKEFQDKGYHSGGRSFGYARGERAHAACDLYAPAGTNIYAIADGKILDYHLYYWKTFALEIDHGEYSVVYGEVQPPLEKNGIKDPPSPKYLQGLPDKLGRGMTVKKGQHIAFVGQLYVKDGPTPFEHTMVHFELYKNTATGAFTQKTNLKDYDYVPSKPYKRRRDLLDPTDFLDKTDASITETE